jgi:hypothetical protein
MENPFSYSGVVTGDSFCNRENELSELAQLTKDCQNVLIYSHRKTGKSSLIFELIRQISEEKADIKTMYVDLYGTLTEQGFVDAMFAALPQVEPQYKKVLKAVPGISLSVSVDPVSGAPTFSVGASPAQKKHLLSKTMDMLDSLSKKKRLVIALDEFQEISEYAEEGFEKRLRSFIQTHDRIAYIFCGSQAHLLAEMFQSSKRAFYQSAQSFPLQPIEKTAYVSWAKKLFAAKDVGLPEDIAEDIVERCEYQPLYIQQFLYRFWQSRSLDMEKVEEVEREIIKAHKNEYIAIFNSLTANQKKALKLVAKTGGESIYKIDYLQSFGFSNASVLTRAINSLLDKELIAKNGNYNIQDAMLKKWVLSIA